METEPLPGELAAAAERLRDRLSTFATVTWSTLAAESVEFEGILARVTAAVDAGSPAGLNATYVRLNDLDSRLPAGAHRAYGGQIPDAAPDPEWDRLRVNEILDRLTALTQSPDEQDPEPRRRHWPRGRRG